MMQKANPENAAYFKLNHHALAGSDASGSEWEKEKAWLFSILNDEEVDKSAAKMTPDNKPFTVIRVNAPMDVEVTLSGETLSSGDYSDTTAFGTMNLMGVDDEIKMFCVDTKDGYKVTLNATASGVLEYAVRYYDGNGDRYDERMVTDVEITNKTKITTSVNEAEETVLEIDNDGNGTVDSTLVVNGEGTDKPGTDKPGTDKPETDEPGTDEPDKDEPTIEKVASLVAKNQTNSIKLTWDESKDADGYLVYRRTADSSHKVVAKNIGSTNTSFVDENVAKGMKYYYNVAAYKNTDEGEVIGPKRSAATQIVFTKITSVTNQDGSVKIKWTKIDGVAGYKIYRKSEGQDKYSRIKTIEDASKNYYTDKNEKAIVNGKKSQYYVVPFYSKTNSVVTKSAVKTNYYLKREVLSSVNTNGSKKLKVTWKKNDKATGYQVRYSTSKSFDSYKTSKITSKNTLTKTLKDLKKNKTYYVKVRAYKTVNGTNYYSAWSTTKSKKTK